MHRIAQLTTSEQEQGLEGHQTVTTTEMDIQDPQEKQQEMEGQYK